MGHFKTFPSQESTSLSCPPRHQYIPVLPESLNFGPSSTYILLTGSSTILDHNGNCWYARVRLSLHRAEPHCEGTDPLNGAPQPEFQRCVQIVQHGPLVSDAATI